MCSSKESKQVYKAGLGLPMNEQAPESNVAAAAEVANNAADATDNAKKKAAADAAEAKRKAQEAQANAAAPQRQL